MVKENSLSIDELEILLHNLKKEKNDSHCFLPAEGHTLLRNFISLLSSCASKQGFSPMEPVLFAGCRYPVLVLPLVQVTFLFEHTNQSNAAQVLRSFQEANNTLEEISIVSSNAATAEQWLLIGYSAVSTAFILILLLLFFESQPLLGGIRFRHSTK
jgi:hypothetical protein